VTLLALQRPRRLEPGDVVRIVAPSGPIDPVRLQAGAQVLETWGLQVEIGEHVLDRGREGYLAGTDSERASDLERAWCDPRVTAVLCARGGYGVQRMLDLVDWSALRAARPGDEAPVLVGFSDITALHEAIGVELGVVSLLGPMAASAFFLDDPDGREHLRATLFEPDKVPPVTGHFATTLVPGKAEGIVAGGTVSLITAGIGTRSSRHSLAGAILVIEDVDEERYRLDRILTQLRRSGALDGVAGIAGGTWVRCESQEVVDDLLCDRLGDLGVPMVNGLDFGHASPHLTVPLGVRARLDADARTLTALDPPLR
jgi:muramoyltetrapeptide carboxypeptidase